MINFKKLWLVVFFSCSSWAGVEITGSNSFRYTAPDGEHRDFSVTGYVKPSDVAEYSANVVKHGYQGATQTFTTRATITGVTPIRLETIDASENLQAFYDGKVAFIVYLNDGTKLFVFDFLMGVRDYDETIKPHTEPAGVASVSGVSSGVSGVSSGASGVGSGASGVSFGASGVGSELPAGIFSDDHIKLAANTMDFVASALNNWGIQGTFRRDFYITNNVLLTGDNGQYGYISIKKGTKEVNFSYEECE